MDTPDTALVPVDELTQLRARLAALEQAAAEGRHTAALLAHSEARYQALAQATGEMVWATTPDGAAKIDGVIWTAFTGQSAAAVAGWGWLAAIHPEDQAPTAALWQVSLTTGTPYRTEYRVRKYDGSYEYFTVHGVPIRQADGTIREWVGTIRNVHARKVAEAERSALLEAERAARAEAEAAGARLVFLAEGGTALAASLDYQTTLDTLAEIIVPHLADGCIIAVLDPDGGLQAPAVAAVDPAWVALLHRLIAEYAPSIHATSGNMAVLRSGRPELYPLITDAMLAAGAVNAEHLAILRDLPMQSLMCVPLVATGRPIGTITLLSRTASRTYGPADLTLAEELARRGALAVENARLYAASQAAVSLREEFLAIASHELKTPLTGVQIQVQLLQRFADQGRLASLPAERTGAMLQTAERQIKQLVRLINSLLDVSRIGSGQPDLHPEELDLAALLRETLAGLSPELAVYNSPLVMAAAGPVVGWFDRERMVQVVTNLVGNAVKYGRGRPVEISLTMEAGLALLIVRDQGIGIAPDQLERIFNRFARAVPLENYGGLGLGLYIVRQIVTAAGGSIEVTSAPGDGAQFTVRLPCRPRLLPLDGEPAR